MSPDEYERLVDDLTVRIPLPHARTSSGRGCSAKHTSDNLRVRLNIYEAQIVKLICEKLDISVSRFVSWCATHAALQIAEKLNINTDEPINYSGYTDDYDIEQGNDP